jgi:hypothetical protein
MAGNATANGRGRRRPGRRSENVGSGPSTRGASCIGEKLRGSMQREPQPSKPRWMLLRRDQAQVARWDKEKERLDTKLGAHGARALNDGLAIAGDAAPAESFGRALGTGIADRIQHVFHCSDCSPERCPVGDPAERRQWHARERVDRRHPLPPMLLAFANRAGLNEDSDRPAIDRAMGWRSLLQNWHREVSGTLGMNPRDHQLFRLPFPEQVPIGCDSRPGL